MNEDRAKTPRTLLVADHLWEAITAMAAEMGSDREALINQALFTYARLNGYLVPSDLNRVGSVPPPPMHDRRGPGATAQPPPTGRVSAEEERTMRPPVEGSIEVNDVLPADQGAHAASMDLPSPAEPGLPPPKDASAIVPGHAVPEPAAPDDDREGQPAAGQGSTLVLMAQGREIDRVVKERFLIGRGKHCDLIINSGKVSREHAAITREGGDYFIEDLGSSNGTWHEKRRITRRQIQEGDEYLICAEKLGCTFR